MRQVVVVLLLFILATSYAINGFDDDVQDEPNVQDNPFNINELEKKADCQDRMSTNSCLHYKRYCSQSERLRQYCPKTCNECTQQQCIDNDDRCPDWIYFCSTNSWVEQNCRRTCNKCNKPPTPRPTPRPRPTTQPPLPRCDPYKTESRSCVTWKERGYCRESSQYFLFMKKKCSGTCGLCRGYKPVTPAPEKPHTAKVDIQECLSAHNKYRRRHGAPSLKWDENIAKEAQQYALKLARINHMEHDQTIRGKYGENLAWSYHSSGTQKYTCKDATKAWYDEIKDYSFSNPGFHSSTGHFTQVVWKASRVLGVGIAKNGGNTYVVARYSPPGNYIGQFRENVGRSIY